MDHKSILAGIKAIFNAPVVPAAPALNPVPVVPAAPAVLAGTVFKLKDGSEISIAIKDPAVTTAPSVGDMVSIGGAPAPEGVYELEDGTSLTTDATGAITIIVEPMPATQPEFTAPPVKTLEERITALEIKTAAPAAMEAVELQMSAQSAKLDEANAKIEKQNQVITQLFELCEKLCNEPMTTPATLTGSAKDAFEKRTANMSRLERMGEARKSVKILN